MQRRVFTGEGARHAAIAHARLKHHAHVTAHNYKNSRAVFYTTHPVFECLPLPRHFVNNDPGLPCAHMFEVLDREQAHRVYFDVDDGERAVTPETLLRQSAQGLVDWLNAEFGLQLTSGDLYVSSKCRPDKTSWWMVLHLRLRGMRARRRFKQLLQSARARDPRLAKVDPAPYQSTQLLAMIGCSKGTKPGYPRTPVTYIRGMRFAQGTTRHDHMIAVDVPGEPLLQCHMTPHAHGSATRDRRPAHGRRAAQAAAVPRVLSAATRVALGIAAVCALPAADAAGAAGEAVAASGFFSIGCLNVGTLAAGAIWLTYMAQSLGLTLLSIMEAGRAENDMDVTRGAATDGTALPQQYVTTGHPADGGTRGRQATETEHGHIYMVRAEVKAELQDVKRTVGGKRVSHMIVEVPGTRGRVHSIDVYGEQRGLGGVSETLLRRAERHLDQVTGTALVSMDANCDISPARLTAANRHALAQAGVPEGKATLMRGLWEKRAPQEGDSTDAAGERVLAWMLRRTLVECTNSKPTFGTGSKLDFRFIPAADLHRIAGVRYFTPLQQQALKAASTDAQDNSEMAARIARGESRADVGAKVGDHTLIIVDLDRQTWERPPPSAARRASKRGSIGKSATSSRVTRRPVTGPPLPSSPASPGRMS